MSSIIISDAQTLTLELSAVVATNQPTFATAYIDKADGAIGGNNNALNGTTPVTAVASPATGNRAITRIDVTNLDTASVTVIAKVGTSTVIRRTVPANASMDLMQSSKGDPGEAGTNGDPGVKGDTGEKGDPGDKGDTGSIEDLLDPTVDHTANGWKEALTVGEDVAFGDLLYLKSDGIWWKADADLAAEMPGLRLALETALADASCSCLIMGRAMDETWTWTVGGLVYASTVAGALTQTAPTGTTDQVQVIGIAYHADKIIFSPSPVLAEVK